MVLVGGSIEIPKLWGKEIVNENHDRFCSKKLVMNKGSFSSIHYHKDKMENFALEKGHLRLELGDEVIDLLPGMSVTIWPEQSHRFAAYEDSEIFEASTFHSDDDVYRIENSYLARELYALDCDGTLANCGGSVEKAHMDGKEYGMVSSRSRSSIVSVCNELGLEPLFVINSRILSKTEELKMVDGEFPLRRTIYIGDQESDMKSAQRAGWQFIFAREFTDLEEIDC